MVSIETTNENRVTIDDLRIMFEKASNAKPVWVMISTPTNQGTIAERLWKERE
jgi:hypothetical protein